MIMKHYGHGSSTHLFVLDYVSTIKDRRIDIT